MTFMDGPQIMLAPDGRRKVPRSVPVAIVVVSVALLGILGWVLPVVGRSLAVPSLIVCGVGVVVVLGSWLALGAWKLTAALAAITVGASVWTFAFSLPTAMILDTGANSQTQAALALSNGGENPCLKVSTGSVGPISVPYNRCVWSSNVNGYLVTYASAGRVGIAFTNESGSAFPDECARHLTGEWWMYTQEVRGVGNCPIGYQAHGGG